MRASSSHRALLWFGVGAPVAAWAVQGLASFLLVFELCRRGAAELARTLVLGLSAVAMLLSCAALAVGVHSYRKQALTAAVGDGERHEQDQMLALVAILVATTLGIAIGWNGLPVLTLSSLCEATR